MALNCTTAEEVVRTIKDKNVQMVNLRFTDLPGTWQHFSVPPSAVDADAMSDGIGFDGSSIRSFQEIQESDMLVVPDPCAPAHRAAPFAFFGLRALWARRLLMRDAAATGGDALPRSNHEM